MYCKNCGQKLNEGAQFCTICGHKVNPVNQVEVSRGPEDNPKITVRRKSSKAIPIIACLLVVILIVGAGIATGWAAPLRAKYNVSLGDKYIKEGNTEKAIVAMEKANSIDRKNIDSRLKLAELYIDAKQEDKAKALLKEALALDNTNQSTYVILAGVYEKEKNNAELIKLLDDGLTMCKEKDKLQAVLDKLSDEINISDMKATVELGDKYTLPKQAELQIGEDKVQLPVTWKSAAADTSKIGVSSLEGTVKYINKPIALKLSVELKPAVITEKKTQKNEASYTADFTVPEVTMEGKYSGQAASLNSMIQADINKFETESTKTAEDALKDGYIALDGKYNFSIEYKTEYNKNGLISIVLTYSSYTGGAHGMSGKTAYNYDIIQGKVLKLPDLFSEGADPNKIIKEEVVNQMNSDRNSYFGADTDTVRNYNQPFQFYFNEKGVVVYFGEYEIGPYSMGMPEFLITKNTTIR